MPELPEVETMRRGVAVLQGRVIAGASRPRSSKRPITIEPRIDALRRRVVGAEVVAVSRVGKRVVLVLSTDDRLIFEPRMTGLVLLTDPPTRDHLRFRLELAGAEPRELWFWDQRGLGLVRLLTAQQFAEELGPARIGPDALTISREEFRQRFVPRGQPIKVALLDQKLLAGVGNLYASEALFVAGVNPATACQQLSVADYARLHEALIAVLEEAIRYEGSTLSDGTYRNALNERGGYQNHHRVYDRAGQPCLRCQAPIVRIVQAQRSTFYCRACQPAARTTGAAASRRLRRG